MIVLVNFSTSTKDYAYFAPKEYKVGDLVIVDNVKGDFKIVTVVNIDPSKESCSKATKSILGEVNLY